MYTRCPECETTFRVGVHDLRRAQGKVRCGDCQHVFNAVEYLTEANPAENDPAPAVSSPDAIITSADNPYSDEAFLNPANETGILEVLDPEGLEQAAAPQTSLQDDGYELEIKAYDEKTGEAWSPLDVSTWETDTDSGAERSDYSTDAAEAESADDAGIEPHEPPVELDMRGAVDLIDNDAAEEADSSVDAVLSEPDTDATDDSDANKEVTDAEPLYDDFTGIDDEYIDHEDIDDDEATDATNATADIDDEAGSDSYQSDLEAADFDDTLWESIPGVGAAEADHSEIDDIASSENMDFDVPEDKWSTFFGTASKPPVFNKLTVDESDYEGAQLDEAFTDQTEPENAGEAAAETAADMPEVTAEPAANQNDGSDDITADPADNWQELDPIEEVVMATGEFGAAEISSSLEDDTAATGNHKTYQGSDWDPDEWRPGTEDHQAADWQPEYRDPKASTDQPGRKDIWAGTLLLLTIGFALQLLHYNRDQLAASPAWGEIIRNGYNQLGMNLYPAWPIESYEIRGSEAVAGESGPDVLDIRTQIASVSDAPVGLPHLRVILRDRWSNPVAARNFTPDEYLKTTMLPSDGLMQPNQTFGAHVAIVDPGSGAQGFELEICIPRRDTGLDCTGQPFK